MNEGDDPYDIINNSKIKNINRLLIAQLNINSLRNKFEALKHLMSGNIDILVVTESKIDNSFLYSEFYVDGYSKPFQCDRNKNGGGVIIFIREDIPCKALNKHIPRIENISYFLTNL